MCPRCAHLRIVAGLTLNANASASALARVMRCRTRHMMAAIHAHGFRSLRVTLVILHQQALATLAVAVLVPASDEVAIAGVGAADLRRVDVGVHPVRSPAADRVLFGFEDDFAGPAHGLVAEDRAVVA